MQIAQSIPISTSPSAYQYHYSLHPRIYVAPYTHTKSIPTIDADITKPFWSNIPWSSNFDDIRGPDNDASEPSERPNSNCTTKFKMTYTDDYLYILALIESDFDVRATYTKRNSPIFQQDSDFEVFIDPLGACHFYKELEVNAVNTVWNLMLDKPYLDGGREHSGRIADVGDDLYYDVCNQLTAVKIIEGSINNDDDNDYSKDDDKDDDKVDRKSKKTVWAVEMALSHEDTMKHIMKNCSSFTGDEKEVSITPKVGDMWRINFSRVEKKGFINWTWQQQRVWDAKQRKHLGKVNMHLPDIWGYVRFGPGSAFESGSDSTKKQDNDDQITDMQAGEIPMEDIYNGKGIDPLWPMKLAATNVYYAQKQYMDENQEYAHTMDALNDYLDENIMKVYDTSMMILKTNDELDSFLFEIVGNSIENDDGNIVVVSITDDRFIKVKTKEKMETNHITEES